MVSIDPWIWMEAIVTLMVISIMWKENPLYRITEHMMIGATAGLSVFMAYDTLQKNAFTQISQGSYDLVIPVILGLLLFSRYSNRMKYLNRYPIAIMLGVGLGLAVRGIVEANIINQIVNMAVPLSGGPVQKLETIIVPISAIATIVFFIFTTEHRGPIGRIAKIGRWSLMIMFGYLFANASLTRFGWLIARAEFLLSDWLGIIS